jgi:PBSX family phage terminase large subunit
MNVYSLQQQFKKVQKAASRPSVIANLSSGPVEIDPGDLLDYFIAAIRLGDIPHDNKLYDVFLHAEEDKDQGQIFGCLRKLAQNLTPSIEDGDLFLPRDKQAQSILESNDRLNLWYGSIRSSKTIMSLIKWLDRCLNGPKGRRMMVGNTSETLELNCIEPLKDLLPSAITHVTGWRHCIIFGRKVVLRGANDVGQEKKFRGPTLIDAYGDEVTTWVKSIFKMLLTRLSRPGSWFGGTTNPDQPLHWLNVDYIERVKELRLKLWHFVLDDNPGLPEEYKADLIRENPPGTVYYLRFILGLWVAAEGRVYDFLARDAKDEKGLPIIVDELPKSFDRWRVAVDYGTANACVFGLYGRAKNVWYKVKEYYWDSKKEGRQKINSEYSADMRKFLVWGGQPIRPASIEVDPSATGFIAQLRQDFPGFIINKAINDVLPGIQNEAKALYLGWLKIFSGCIKTLEEHFSYLWDETASEKSEEKPIKFRDHTCDETRYMCARLFMGLSKVTAKPAGF